MFAVISLAVVVLGLAIECTAADWPQWRYDAGRSACSPQSLPDELHLLWRRDYPAVKPAFWQVRQERVQFDLGHEPVVVGKTLLVGSSRNDRLTALDTETGVERWRFYADGPIRLAPAAWQNKVHFASDDGCLYCLDIERGSLLWKRRAAPSQRKVVGNGRLISVWPARGGPVVADGRVYFAAGVWPFEGIFVYALDAESGEVVWINDRCGSLYLKHPHAAMSFGGPAPQGYLLIHDDHLVVPSSRAFPAFFDLADGTLATFDFGHGGHGSCPGGWFVATNAEGRLIVDPDINTEGHDAGQQTIGQPGIRRKEGEPLRAEVSVGDRSYEVRPGVSKTVNLAGKPRLFRDRVEGVAGTVHTMLAADGKLFVVTRSGNIFCFGAEPKEPKHHTFEPRPLDPPRDAWTAKVEEILASAGVQQGYAVVLGLGTGRLVEELILQSDLHVVAIDPDAEKVDAVRRRFDQAGVYGDRVAVHQGEPLDFGLPPYLASLVVSEDVNAVGPAADKRFVECMFRGLRPHGGVVCLEIPAERHQAITDGCRDANLSGAKVKRKGPLTLLVRTGSLPGAADYTGEQNFDESLRPPFGLLWFGDTFHHHKLFYRSFHHETGRGLPANIQAVDGVMRYQVTEQPYGPNPTSMSYHQYLRHLEENKTYSSAYVDVYSGRTLSQAEGAKIAFREHGSSSDTQGNLWTIPSPRRNPLTGVEEGREFLKTYGCDRTPVDYGHLCTMRSGTPAYYDKRLESGTVNISGLRSGCRNSIVPGCGILSLPSWTGNCTCNYPVYTSLALVPMPQKFEQWSAWGGVAIEAPVEQMGVNLGAPGDRVAEDGTLWLDFPSVGGPSPEVPIEVTPPEARWYYRHSLWSEGGSGWPWVTASGVEGVRSIRIQPVAKKSSGPGGTIGIRWAGTIDPEFSEMHTFYAESDEGVRLWIDEKLVLDNQQNVRRGERGEVSGTMALESGVKTEIRIEYYGPRNIPEGRRRRVVLQWSSPSLPKTVVHGSRLSAADGQPGGLTAAYYDTSFSGPSILATDTQIDFDWGRDLPPPLRQAAESAKPHGPYSVELFFAEPDDLQPGKRVFSVAIQGKEVLSNFDVVREAGGPMRGVVRRFPGVRVEDALTISFAAKVGQPLVSGIRLIAERAE